MVSAKRLNKLSRTEYRRGYLREMAVTWAIHQIKALRKQRGWSQSDLGKQMNRPQSAIARWENESYGNWNVGTLLELANAFDVALEVRFVSWPQFMELVSDTSEKAMAVPSFSTSQFLAAGLYRSTIEARGGLLDQPPKTNVPAAFWPSGDAQREMEHQWKTSPSSAGNPVELYARN